MDEIMKTIYSVISGHTSIIKLTFVHGAHNLRLKNIKKQTLKT